MMLQYEADQRRLAATVRIAVCRLQRPLRLLWNVNLQLMRCFCGPRRGFGAEGEEGVRQSTAHAAKGGCN